MIKFDTKMTQIRMEIMEDINKFAQLDSAHIEFLGEDFSDLLKTGKLRSLKRFLPVWSFVVGFYYQSATIPFALPMT